jgi:eukaryotic-like serine/threonine-protein kinase
VEASCPEPDEIVRFVQGELAVDPAEAVEVHLDGCESCSRVVSDLVKIWSDDMVSAGSGGPEHEPSPLASHEETLTSRGPPEGGGVGEGVLVLPSGATVGSYRVLDVVGIGGMGVVYSAYDPELDRRVALKVLRPTASSDSSRRNARLQREAQAMAKLSHPNVITIHHVGRTSGRVFIAMEFVDGQTLGAWMKEKRRSWREIRDTFAAAGEGLLAAHGAGLVHRDFKPDNVLIGKDGRVRVTDFGLARFRGDAPEPTTSQEECTDAIRNESESRGGSGPVGPGPTLTRTGAMVGTPAYMAPEQYEGRNVTAATDQFAFCVAMFEAVYGARPFAGTTVAELAGNVCAGTVRPIESGPIPGRVARALRRGLSVRPEDRFESMADLLEIITQRPSRIVRRWALVTVPSVVAALALWGYRTEPSAQLGFCHAEDSMDDVWGESRRESVDAAFRDTRLPYAAQAAEAVMRTVDAYVVEWATLRERLCDEQEVALLKTGRLVTMHCMLERRARLDTLLDVFESADETVVNRAIAAVQSLEPAAGCMQLVIDRAVVPPPPPQEQDRIEAIREEMGRISAMASAGKLQLALDKLETIAAEVAQLGYQPIQAEVKLALGRIEAKLGRAEQARDTLIEAAWHGVESDHRRVSAEAWIELTFLLAARLDDVEEARRAKRAAEAMLSQLGEEPELERRLRVYSGTLALVDERYDEAKEIYERILREDPPEPSVHRATLLMNLGSVEVMRGNPDVAVEHYRSAVGMFVEQFGQMHPRVAGGYYNLGIVLMRRGLLDDALSQFEVAYTLEEATFGRLHPQHAETTRAMGVTLLHMGETDRAIARLEEALDIVGELGMGAEVVGEHRLELASVLAEADRLEEAQSSLLEVRRAIERSESVPPWLRVQALTVEAVIERMQGQPSAALAAAQRAVDLAYAAGDATPLLRVSAIGELAAVHATLGDPARAVELLTPVLASEQAEDFDWVERAGLEFQLARHLRDAGKLGLARDRAQEARQRFDDATRFDKVEEIDVWLAATPPSR